METNESLLPEETHPITFNGIELPLATYWLELVTYILKTVTSEIREWLLDLHYSGGKEQTLPSKTVLDHCGYLDTCLAKNRSEIVLGLKKRLGPSYDPENMLNDWLSTLAIIRASAMTQRDCVWTRPSFVNKESARKMLDFLKQYEPK